MQLLIFHEKLGTDDETATTEEVLDRILYYYSNSSTERENNIDEAEMKIKHLNYCQGMIGFLHKIDEVGHDSAKTKTSIMKTIHLDQFSYIFFQCEPSIWIVLVRCGLNTKSRNMPPLRIDLESSPLLKGIPLILSRQPMKLCMLWSKICTIYSFAFIIEFHGRLLLLLLDHRNP